MHSYFVSVLTCMYMFLLAFVSTLGIHLRFVVACNIAISSHNGAVVSDKRNLHC